MEKEGYYVLETSTLIWIFSVVGGVMVGFGVGMYANGYKRAILLAVAGAAIVVVIGLIATDL